MSEPLVIVETASVIRGDKRLIDGVTVTVGRGERIAVIGANGSGKTTLLRVMAGAIQPEEGSVRRLPGAAGERDAVAIVWQGLHLVSRLSVEENVLIGALARCCSRATWFRVFPPLERERARHTIDLVGIASLAQERVDRLSGGERQRVAIARALMQDAPLMLADEPTASLDPSAARDIAALLAKLAMDRGLALVTVLHDVSLIDTVADRVVALGAGRVVFDGPRARLDAQALALTYS